MEHRFITDDNERFKIHSKLMKNKKELIKGLNFFNRTSFVIYSNIDGIITCFDGNRTFNLTGKELNDNVSNYDKTKPLYTKCHHCRNEKVHTTLYECYCSFRDENKAIRRLTKDLVSPMMNGTPPKLSKYLFLMFNHNKDFFPITNPEEYRWNIDSTKGSFIWCDNGFKGEVQKYDINSAFPYILQSSLKFPYKEGEFLIIDKLPKKLKYGTYRCKITGINPKLFKHNETNKYTHIDIKLARKYDYNIELIQDGQPNFLYYNDDCLYSGTEIFKDVIDYLYKFKKEKKEPTRLIKTIITSMYGILTQHNHFVSTIGYDEEFDMPEKKLISLTRNRTNKTMTITYVDESDGYKGIMPRLNPFMLSQSRYRLSQMIYPDIDKIVRVQTDSFYTTELDVEYETGVELGELKYEGQGYVDIIHVNLIKDENGKYIVGKKN